MDSLREKLTISGIQTSDSVDSRLKNGKMFAHVFAFTMFVIGLVLGLVVGLAGKNPIYSCSSPVQPSPSLSPVKAIMGDFMVTLNASGFTTDDVLLGPVWSPSEGVGILAQNSTTRQVYASAGGIEVLLDTPGNFVYVYNSMAKSCFKYEGASVRPLPAASTNQNMATLSFVNQYFCSWIYPSPCSWNSVENYYLSLLHSDTIQIGEQKIENFWLNYTISVAQKFTDATGKVQEMSGSYPKTVALQYGDDGTLTHLSHWTGNQNAFPFYSQYSIAHSDDQGVNIHNQLSQPSSSSMYLPRTYWSQCILVPL